ncbi:MAG: MFS transporter [Desulfomonile tiedjei]|uniref:MFS transporter n=1 Tax=Desulfomonile tiedjei TaxID=2358 RepID=A0A9D6V096_9BACT|nr:MFS transporter [Desulfomonile tiedjei]
MKLNRKLVLVSLIYFAEGFPFGIIEQTLPVYFRVHGMSLAHIGLLSLVSLPYALKFLWAPAVDFIGKRRHWISAAQLMMAALILLLLPLDPADPSSLLWACIASLAIMSATQDIAIDAYSIELLKPSEMGMANGFRQAAYRVAMIVAGGLFLYLAEKIGWNWIYFAASGVLLGCSFLALHLPHIEVERPSFSLASLVAPIRDILERPGLVQVVLFILLYKLGDMAIGPMVRPFWLARGLSLTEIGLITGSLGIVASIVGGLAGGVFMSRFGIFHGIWFLGMWQCLSNLTYVGVAVYPQSGHFGIYAASVVESFCAGLGTSAFLAFLMSISKKQFSATQYAVFSALFRVTGIIAGSLSGWATEGIGYAHYFGLTFLLSLPAFLFIFHAKRWIPSDNNADCDS